MAKEFVLTLRLGQCCVIPLPDGREALIYLSDVERNKVKLSVDAPRDVVVNRGEVQAEVDAALDRWLAAQGRPPGAA